MSFRKLRKGSLFTKNFIILLTIFSVIFLLFSLYIYDNSMDILTREIGLSADGVLSNMSSSIDGYFNDARYIVALLETNPKIRAFFTFEHPDLLYSDYELSVEDYLKAINESHEYIDSIYLYRESSHTIMSQAGQINASLHFDTNWLDLIDWEDDGIQFIFRAKKEWYDHTLPRMTLGISKLLRYSIDGADLVLLKDELEFAKQYVFIMEQRYSNLFHTTYVIDENCLCAKVPKLIIQPLIENAILHGFLDADISGGQLTIASRMDGQNCVLSVTDNGGGISREKLQELNESIRQDGGYTEIGVKNVFTRMKLLYGNDFLMEIDSEIGKGSTFTLRFPAAR